MCLVSGLTIHNSIVGYSDGGDNEDDEEIPEMDNKIDLIFDSR